MEKKNVIPTPKPGGRARVGEFEAKLLDLICHVEGISQSEATRNALRMYGARMGYIELPEQKQEIDKLKSVLQSLIAITQELAAIRALLERKEQRFSTGKYDFISVGHGPQAIDDDGIEVRGATDDYGTRDD